MTLPRGYLWQALAEEIIEEFAELTPPALTIDMMSEHVADDIRYSVWSARELFRLPTDVRKRLDQLVRKRAAAEWGREQRRLHRLENSRVQKKRPPRVPPAPTKHQRQYQERKKMREKMPSERPGFTQRFTLVARKFDEKGAPVEGVTEELKGYITASVYPDKREDGSPHPRAGQLGEVFIKFGKAGSREALLDQWAISFSRELQYGAHPAELCRKHRHTQFEPSGRVKGVAGIGSCTSPTDLVCHWIERKFLGFRERVEAQP